MKKLFAISMTIIFALTLSGCETDTEDVTANLDVESTTSEFEIDSSSLLEDEFEELPVSEEDINVEDLASEVADPGTGNAEPVQGAAANDKSVNDNAGAISTPSGNNKATSSKASSSLSKAASSKSSSSKATSSSSKASGSSSSSKAASSSSSSKAASSSSSSKNSSSSSSKATSSSSSSSVPSFSSADCKNQIISIGTGLGLTYNSSMTDNFDADLSAGSSITTTFTESSSRLQRYKNEGFTEFNVVLTAKSNGNYSVRIYYG